MNFGTPPPRPGASLDHVESIAWRSNASPKFVLKSEDAKEGIKFYAEKRTPKFKGR